MPRVRSQLAIQAPPELLERVRSAAAARGQTVTRLLIGWIEAGLSGDLPAPGAGPDLAARVQALEAAVAQLQAQAAAPRSAERVEPLRVPLGAGQLEIIGAKHLHPPAEAPFPERVGPVPAGAIPTGELAERTGTNRAAWNNWARADRVGDVRNHPQAGPWRLVGQAPGPGGGPLRWLWEPA